MLRYILRRLAGAGAVMILLSGLLLLYLVPGDPVKILVERGGSPSRYPLLGACHGLTSHCREVLALLTAAHRRLRRLRPVVHAITSSPPRVSPLTAWLTIVFILPWRRRAPWDS